MKLLLTGANGYIGTRLIPVLLEKGHEVVCLVRDKRRFHEQSDFSNKVTIITGDLLHPESINPVPPDIDAAYYLVHSMSQDKDFAKLEAQSARNFTEALSHTHCKQIIYLSGISNDENLSEHLSSRLHVENVLKESDIPVTILRAAIVIGSGSSSFEIIRDLTEKLPIMITPRWIKTRCQPIAIRDVLAYLEGVALNEKSFDKNFDIAGLDILSFKDMMLGYAKVRGLKRRIITLPFLSPKISSYWLYFVTSTSYALARSLVESMKNETIARNKDIDEVVPHKCIGYQEALKLAFEKIEQNSIVSSWKDALNMGYLRSEFMDQIKVPQKGTLDYRVKMPFTRDTDKVMDNLWSIGGQRGWYYWNWIWNLRGFIDKLVGGVGSRRGRTNSRTLSPGDAVDFWRVLLADKASKRILLYAEMRLPGEAWLEFQIQEKGTEKYLCQTATYRPNGIWGRAYWYLMWPFHYFIFNGMARQMINYDLAPKTMPKASS